MFKKTILLGIALSITLAANIWAAPWPGSGTEGDPYQISSAADMNEIGADPNYWDAHFLLMDDIDLSGYTGTAFHIIGNDSNNFTGVFDGNDHFISNFTYSTPGADDIGLFGYVGTGGEIKDLSLLNINVDAGTGLFVGGLVGWNENGIISNCCATGTVTGDSRIGGLVGYNSGTVSNCYATGEVSGDEHVGGLVGCQDFGKILSCYATGSVTGGDSVGGLVGFSVGAVSNSYATGPVTGGDSAGGLVGCNYGVVISNCYATGEVLGDDRVGGLVGYNIDAGRVSYCYATGDVEGGYEVGGLVGSNFFGTVSYCYAAPRGDFGYVLGDDRVGGLMGCNEGSVSHCYACVAVLSYGMDVGGLVGYEYGSSGSYTSCFWYIDVNPALTGVGNITDPPDVMGRTTAQMKTQSTFTDYGWDFVGESANGTDDIWRMCVDDVNYPFLWWQFNKADFDCPDGVDFIDFSVLASAWRAEDGQPKWNHRCDISDPNDNCIDELDLKVFTDNWLFGVE